MRSRLHAGDRALGSNVPASEMEVFVVWNRHRTQASVVDRSSLHRRRGVLRMLLRRTLKPWMAQVGAAGIGWFSAGCSLTVDANRAQCNTDSECNTGPAALAGGFCNDALCDVKPEWSCLNGAPEIDSGAREPSASSQALEIRLPAVDLVDLAPVGALPARLCRKLDLNCDAPIQSLASDADGVFSLTLDAAFDGYLELEGPTVVPTLYFFSPALNAAGRLPTLTLMKPAMLESLMEEMDATLSTDRGVAILTAQNCMGAFSAGVAYETADADPETIEFYATDGLPSLRATRTDTSGFGGFLNLPAGPVSVTGTLTESSLPLASVSVLVRSGFITYGHIVPGALPASPIPSSNP
jgi:hypothetical protein